MIVTTHTSATAHKETPHNTETTITKVSDATRRRAESVTNDSTMDPQSRTVMRPAMELDDPRFAELLRRAAEDEDIVDTFESLGTLEANEDDSTLRKIEALAEIVCRAGDEPTAALFMLMETLESSANPEVFTSRAKHVAFSRCGELQVYELVDAQIAEIERELFSDQHA
jgi:hypothetical protein